MVIPKSHCDDRSQDQFMQVGYCQSFVSGESNRLHRKQSQYQPFGNRTLGRVPFRYRAPLIPVKKKARNASDWNDPFACVSGLCLKKHVNRRAWHSKSLAFGELSLRQRCPCCGLCLRSCELLGRCCEHSSQPSSSLRSLRTVRESP